MDREVRISTSESTDGQEPNLTNFYLFSYFLNGDKRLKDALHWAFSIRGKAEAVSILFKEVLDQLQKCYIEMVKAKQQPYSSYNEYLILTIKYEVFLNSMYSLCESLSYVVQKLYPFSLSPHFHKQKTRFLNNLTIDPDYSAILKNTDWYDEVQCMRANSTHFLSGFIVQYGENHLGFVNIPISERKSGADRILKAGQIKIDDIEKHIKQTYSEFKNFLSLFGNHFVRLIDQEAKMTIPCISSDDEVIGFRSISLKSHFNGEKWTCMGSKDCVLRDRCNTVKLENS